MSGKENSQKNSVFDFSKLDALRRLCKEMQQYHYDSLGFFKYDVGFQHVLGSNKISISSSATCVLSLVATEKWNSSPSDTTKLVKSLIGRNTSAGLPVNNPFTIAWILEAVTILEDHAKPFDAADRRNIDKKVRILQDEIRSGNGAVSIEKYPASSYLTQLVVRVLLRRKKLTASLQKLVREWAWKELTRQLALVQAKSKTQDAFSFAYLLMLVTAVTPLSKISPERASIQRAALKTVFDCQLLDGTWPLSRPLFHYPKVGNAHCYEYEMLTQLLSGPELVDLLLDNLQGLSGAANALQGSVYRLEKGVRAWASGHHPQLEGPESWTTASVYHFLHRLDRLLAEAVRRELFRYVDQPLPRTVKMGKNRKNEFAPAPGFLDSRIDLPGKLHISLRDFLWDKFVKPISEEADKIINGNTFGKGTPISAIFFGPPGTSKTELSQKVADFVGWPRLSIDPSMLLRSGMDNIQAEANTIFRMLEQTEGVVVLFDEFDELVRERESSDAEAFSRFLTTAMLPKLASIHRRATIVFILATNNIGEFDVAIRRQGRFDRVIQIMPPTYKAKMSKKDWGISKINIRTTLKNAGVTLNTDIRNKIGDLTFGECEDFATELARVTNRKSALATIADKWNRCTLQTRVSKGRVRNEDEISWRERSKMEAQHNR